MSDLDCRQCGACCKGNIGTFPETGEFTDGPCVWLGYFDGQWGCAWYGKRPAVCREVEVGGELCLRWRRKMKVDDGVIV